MRTLFELNQVFSIQQLSQYVVLGREMYVGDVAVMKIKGDEPAKAYFVYVRKIIEHAALEQNTEYEVEWYDNDNHRVNIASFKRHHLSEIVPVDIPEDAYQKAKLAFDKKIAKEKLAEALTAVRRRTAKKAEKEEPISLAEQEYIAYCESQRRETPMTITVGMWEDLMNRLEQLEDSI